MTTSLFSMSSCLPPCKDWLQSRHACYFFRQGPWSHWHDFACKAFWKCHTMTIRKFHNTLIQQWCAHLLPNVFVAWTCLSHRVLRCLISGPMRSYCSHHYLAYPATSVHLKTLCGSSTSSSWMVPPSLFKNRSEGTSCDDLWHVLNTRWMLDMCQIVCIVSE